MKKKPKSEYAIQTVSNALRLLEVFNEQEELGVTELSRRLALHKNNVFRILATLQQRGYVVQNALTQRYRLGVRSLEVGQAFSRSHKLLRRAPPVLEQLAEQTGESAHLGLLRDFEVAHVDCETRDQLLQAGSRIGWRLPVHCTALGKVLLGFSPQELIEAWGRSLGAGGGLERRTPATVGDPHKLVEHLRTVTGQGFALDLEECAAGLSCAAAPVFDASGELVAALSVSGPACRLDEASLRRDTVPLVTAAAERLSRDLGFG